MLTVSHIFFFLHCSIKPSECKLTPKILGSRVCSELVLCDEFGSNKETQKLNFWTQDGLWRRVDLELSAGGFDKGQLNPLYQKEKNLLNPENEEHQVPYLKNITKVKFVDTTARLVDIDMLF